MEAKLNDKDLYMLSENLSAITEAAITHGSWSAKMGMKSSTEGYLHILNMVKDAMEVLYLWNAMYDHAAKDIELALNAMKDDK